MTPLDFATKRDSGSDSWRRADPSEAVIVRTAWNRWLVVLLDSFEVHEVRLERDHGAFEGECRYAEPDTTFEDQARCKARKYNADTEPCAQLCTLRKAAFLGLGDATGEPVRVFERDDAEIAAADSTSRTRWPTVAGR